MNFSTSEWRTRRIDSAIHSQTDGDVTWQSLTLYNDGGSIEGSFFVNNNNGGGQYHVRVDASNNYTLAGDHGKSVTDASTIQASTSSANPDTIVVKVENTGVAPEQTASIWINPSAATEGQLPAADLSVTYSAFANNRNLGQINLRPGGISIDNIIFAEDYIDLGIVPPGPPVVTWTTDGTGDWASAGNWDHPTAPGGNTTTVIFGSAITASATVVTDAAVTVKNIDFNNANTYAVGGTGTVTLEADTGNATIDVTQGVHQFQAAVTLASNTDVDVAASQSLAFNNALNLGGKTLTKTGAGGMSINNQLTTGGGTVVVSAGPLSGTGMVGGNLTLGSSFVFELDDEDGAPLVVDGQLTLAPWTLVLDGQGRTDAITTGETFPVFEFDSVTTGGLPAGPWDLNSDGTVNDGDLNMLLSDFGGGGTYDQADLDDLLADFGQGSGGPPTDPFNATIQLGPGTSGWNTTNWDLVQVGNQLLLTGISAPAAGPASVPEPGSLALLALAGLALAPVLRRRT